MIDALILENFKAFGSRQIIPLAPITLIFGANSSGKSSILQALLLSKQLQADPSYDGDISLNGSLVSIGGFHDLVYNHERGRECEISIAFRPLVTKPNPFYRAFGRENEGYSGFLDEQRDELIRWGYGEPRPDSFEDADPVALGLKIAWNPEHSRASLSELPLYISKYDRPLIVWDRYKAPEWVSELESGEAQRARVPRAVRFSLKSVDRNHPKWEHLFRRYLTTRLKPDLRRLAPFVEASSLTAVHDLGDPVELGSDDTAIPASLDSKYGMAVSNRSMLDTVKDRQFLQQFYETMYQRSLLTDSTTDGSGRTRQQSHGVNLGSQATLAFDEYLSQLYVALSEFGLEEFVAHVIDETKVMDVAWGDFRIHIDCGIDQTEITPFFEQFPNVRAPEILAADLERVLVPSSHSLPNVAIFAEQLVANRLRAILEAIRYVGPIRVLPDRVLVRTGRIYDSVGSAGEAAPEMLLAHQILVEETNTWLDRLDVGYRIEIAAADTYDTELFSLRLIDRVSGASLPPHAVGVGVSQVLPVIVESLWSRGNVVLIEQPELHLHPKLQTEIGSLFAECVNAERGNQFIIETHSEHLILRLQRLVRQGILTSSDVSVLYVDKTEAGSFVRRLRLDDDGDFIDEWPNGFFEEGFKERFDI